MSTERKSEEQITAELLDRIPILLEELSTKQIDRKKLSKILVISLFSYKHTFLLGEPGVSKTGILEIFATVVKNGKTFDICIKHDTKYEEIFGDRFRDEAGRMVYDTTNSIIEADFATIDETWKGNSKVMNSLLSIMSGYRKIDIMGKGTVEAPLIMVGGASNELPTDVEVRPLRDRFLFSYKVEKINNKEDWIKFASRNYNRDVELKTKFTPTEIFHIFVKSQDIELPSIIYETLFKIRQKVVLLNIGVSDRKFDQAIDAFKVSALINKRKEVNFSELFLLQHILWNVESDIPILLKILNDEIFGELDIVLKFNDDTAGYKAKINSFIRGEMADFLKHRHEISHGEKDYFENQKNRIEETMQNYDILLSRTTSVVDLYNASMMIEQQTKENIVGEYARCPIFASVNIENVFNLQGNLEKEKADLQNWLLDNEELHSYNMNAHNK